MSPSGCGLDSAQRFSRQGINFHENPYSYTDQQIEDFSRIAGTAAMIMGRRMGNFPDNIIDPSDCLARGHEHKYDRDRCRFLNSARLQELVAESPEITETIIGIMNTRKVVTEEEILYLFESGSGALVSGVL